MLLPGSRELIEKGQRLYDDRLKAHLEVGHMHEFVAIEPESGDYFLGPTLSDASAACRAVHPNRRAYVVRVGHPAAIHLGGVR